MKYGILSAECDGKPLERVNGYTYIIPPGAKDINIHASVRNYSFSDVGVRFFVKELESKPRTYNWNEIEPVKIFKPDSPQYSVCLQILDSTGERVLQETTYTLRTEMKPWDEPGFRTYLIAVCTEAVILALVSLIGIVFFVTRKNELEKVQTELEEKIKDQTSELVAKQNTIKALFIQTVTALSEAVDAKDRYTSGHSKRVAEYSRMIAARMGKTKEEQEEIYRAGLLHDVGKIRVPVEIINKAGKLTDEEYDIIKIHPITGYHILRGISGSRLIAISAKYHHERYDGRGYPNGLEGDRIPEAARILGVADAYDAMTSTRSYRKALPQEVVRAEIEKGKGTQFDPAIADIMLQMITASNLTKNDVAIAVSYEGRSKNVVDAIRIAKERGATTISVTRRHKSPLLDYTDIRLLVSAKDLTFGRDKITRRIADQFILEALYLGYESRMDSKAKERIKYTQLAINNNKI